MKSSLLRTQIFAVLCFLCIFNLFISKRMKRSAPPHKPSCNIAGNRNEGTEIYKNLSELKTKLYSEENIRQNHTQFWTEEYSYEVKGTKKTGKKVWKLCKSDSDCLHQKDNNKEKPFCLEQCKYHPKRIEKGEGVCSAAEGLGRAYGFECLYDRGIKDPFCYYGMKPLTDIPKIKLFFDKQRREQREVAGSRRGPAEDRGAEDEGRRDGRLHQDRGASDEARRP